ncbi:MAG: two component transcriptional regulator, LuxR family [Acidobacteriaceae bacterium]|nr:two component transcriptional regulator, LuxR family [Acidobacteriaceae bacterium]
MMIKIDTTNAIRIIIAHHSPVTRFGLRQLLVSSTTKVISEAADAHAAWMSAQLTSASILILEFEIPGGVWALLQNLGNKKPCVRTILLADKMSAKQVRQAIESGVRGILNSDSPPELIAKGVRTVVNGQLWLQREQLTDLFSSKAKATTAHQDEPTKYFLTVRQSELVELIARGYCNREIALNLNLSEQTVKQHLNHIFHKLGLRSRLELATLAFHDRISAPAELRKAAKAA